MDIRVLFLLRFTPCKAEQPLQCMELQGKEEKDEKQKGELFRKNTKKNRCLLTHFSPVSHFYIP